MLQVYLTKADRDKDNIRLRETEGFYSFPDGLTPPTHDIIKRKYTKTHQQKPHPVND
jgi:hypothetical protein